MKESREVIEKFISENVELDPYFLEFFIRDILRILTQMRTTRSVEGVGTANCSIWRGRGEKEGR